MKPFKIYIVEDDHWYGEIIKFHLSLNPDWEVHLYSNGNELLNHLHESPSVITLDYSMPDMSGLQVLKKIKAINETIPVVVISGQDDIETAVELIQEGAYDYIVKNEGTKSRIWNVIKNIRENVDVKQELELLKEEITQKYNFSKSIIGSSAPINQTFKLMEKATKTNINVSISGETGTGKELVAKAIHYNSAQQKHPFIAINMSAIPKDLIESELFGHEKGAFTGANTRRIGKFEEAQKGTLFLDEIGDLDINMQAKLLRALQEKEIVRIGGNKAIKTNARIIVATHRNLNDEVKKGSFREDLYFRLLGLPIHLAPLRERREDIILLAKHFVNLFCKENDLKPLNLSTSAQKKLLKYPYPGNIRELKSVIDLACVMANTTQIENDDISFSSSSSLQQNYLNQERSLKEYNRHIISQFLKKYNNDIIRVAQKLQIGKSTIYRMIKNNEITL